MLGWKLDAAQRIDLLERFPPAWPDVIAHHVTLQAGADPAAPLPPPVRAEIVGSIDDGAGLQALVVEIDGTTDRPDGSTYHITWSLDRARGREAVESNAVIAERGWRPVTPPVHIAIEPARLR